MAKITGKKRIQRSGNWFYVVIDEKRGNYEGFSFFKRAGYGRKGWFNAMKMLKEK